MKKDFIYLASASPRRRELLDQIGIPFRIRPAGLHELPAGGEAPQAFVQRMAREKAAAVWSLVTAANAQPVLAADTVVVLDGRIFGKPADAGQARSMLARLSGAVHQVLTSVAVAWEGDILEQLVISEVRLRATTAAERRAYADTGEPLDKAGGYGVQGRGRCSSRPSAAATQGSLVCHWPRPARCCGALVCPGGWKGIRECVRRFWSTSRPGRSGPLWWRMVCCRKSCWSGLRAVV